MKTIATLTILAIFAIATPALADDIDDALMNVERVVADYNRKIVRSTRTWSDEGEGIDSLDAPTGRKATLTKATVMVVHVSTTIPEDEILFAGRIVFVGSTK